MKCSFDICEFYNIFFGGILTGVIASFMFVWLTDYIAHFKFRKRYGYLKSNNPETFDWTAYSMKPEDGRLREDTPDGSKLNIVLHSDRFRLTLKESGGGIWIGELIIKDFDFGLVTYKYKDRHEYGQRNCTIGHFVENDETFDYIFLTPINNKIYYIEKIEQDKQPDRLRVIYNYGDEIFIRRRTSG